MSTETAQHSSALNRMSGSNVTLRVQENRASVGSNHTCRIQGDGILRCWGYNYFGQLGLGDTLNRGATLDELREVLPVDLGPGRTARSVSAGQSSTCALLDDSTVKCWGANGSGQLGLGDTASRGDGPGEMGASLPAVDLGEKVIAVSTGASHACAILESQNVKCWGWNFYGQLGLGDTTDRGTAAGQMGVNLPVVNLGGRKATAIMAGSTHTCAVLDNGGLKCWGQNNYGQLGLDDINNRGDAAGEMGTSLAQVNVGTGRTVQAVLTQTLATCALLDDGNVKCWGYNFYGQLGIGNQLTKGDQAGEMATLPSVSLGTGRKALALSGGDNFSCVQLDNGSVKCWGYAQDGRLGTSDQNNRGYGPNQMGDYLPTLPLGTGVTVQALVSSTGRGGSACAILSDGAMKCWGAGNGPSLGNRDWLDRGDGGAAMSDSLPIVAVGRTVVHGYSHSCALLEGGQVKCWGINNAGQLGYGDTTARGTSGLAAMGTNLPTVNLGTGLKAVYLAAGGNQTCAVLSNGGLKCWGENSYAQLGLGDFDSRGDDPGEMGDSLPQVSLGTGRTVRAVTVGAQHACAHLDNNTIKCWGDGQFGQLGLGNTDIYGDTSSDMGDNLPAVDLALSVVRVSAGNFHTCALLQFNKVKCWGSNTFGSLGYGDTNNRGDDPGEMGSNLPYVELAMNPISISTGGLHSCAYLTSGVKCWGYNSGGQLGVGDANARGDDPNEMGANLALIALGTGRSIRGVRAGSTFTCALLDNNAVKCWGSNSQGELGLGHSNNLGDGPSEMGDNLAALSLGTNRSAADVFVGGSKACAVLNGGTIKCWGGNFDGALGYGDTNSRGDNAGEMGDSLAAVQVGTGAAAQTIALAGGATSAHHCIVRDDGTVRCWGKNDYGQLGLGNTAHRGDNANEMGSALPAVGLGAPARAVAVGSSFSCAILADFRVKCWGRNDVGQLGVGAVDSRGDAANELTTYTDLGTGRAAVSIAAGSSHVCAILENGMVKCWGSNSFGQLGLGDVNNRGDNAGEMGSSLAEVSLGTNKRALALSLGHAHTCALLDDGSIKCWGSNNYGQLGLGDTSTRGDSPGEMGDSLPPVGLGTGRTAQGLTSGNEFNCVVLDNGSVKCWGYGAQGSLGLENSATLGDGPAEMNDALPAVALGTGRTARLVRAGGTSTCAVLDNGTAKCWGSNTYGNLGYGDTAGRGGTAGTMGSNLPALDLGTGRSVRDIGGSAEAKCALLDDGTIKCWGRNLFGQLGEGTLTSRGDGAGEMGNAMPVVVFAD